MFTMRFDMRSRDGAAHTSALYEAACDMAAWGDAQGCAQLQVSEHHASADGYLPAPLILAAAFAARTRRVPIQVAALLLPLHDPVELAEQMAVLDHLSGGRVGYICALGYRAEEYAMFGRDMKRRGRRMEECLAVLRRAFSGEPFDYEGRKVRVTPAPRTPGGPPLFMGGNTPAAVRRAAKFGMGMITQGGDATLDALYRQACAEFGSAPQTFINPQGDAPHSAFVAVDPERAWRELGPYLLHDAQQYAAWLGDSAAATKSTARSVEELRAENGAYRIFSVPEAVEEVRRNGLLLTQPLAGGIPPALAWPHLRLIAEQVLPAL